jgi:ABC-type dipeptide/oligopeptide/nickel transport system permease component
MTRYIGGRIATSLPVLLGVSIIVFAIMRLLPGDPIIIMFGEQPTSAEVIERLRAEYGLTDPIPVQYLRFLGDALTGDLGRSIRTGAPVLGSIVEQFPRTLELTAAAMIVALVFGLTAGVLAAVTRHGLLDYAIMTLALFGVATPSFWLGLMLVLVFAVNLRWLPTSGQGDLAHLILPALTLGAGGVGLIARMTRSALLDTLARDYVRTAHAKGLSRPAIVVRHALKNALIPVITVVGLQFGQLLAGAVVIEIVFARQGIGFLVVNAMLKRDFPVAQGVILFSAVVYVFVNLAIDVLYAYVDPRIRLS